MANDAVRLVEPWQAGIAVRRGTQEDDPRESYYIGECGHRVTAESGVDGLLFRVGACRECDEEE